MSEVDQMNDGLARLVDEVRGLDYRQILLLQGCSDVIAAESTLDVLEHVDEWFRCWFGICVVAP